MENILGNTTKFFHTEYCKESCIRTLLHIPAKCTVRKLCELYEFFCCLNILVRKKESPHVRVYTMFHFRAVLTDR